MKRHQSMNGHKEDEDSKVVDVTLSNVDAVDCNFCQQPLSIFIFKCTNGHILCSSCCSNSRMCIICNPKRAIVACANEPYGCKEMVNYSQRYAHIKSCDFSPCLCPETDCNFRANSMELGRHFKTNHQLRVPPFTYGEVFSALIHIKDDVTILQGKSDGELFVITCKTHYIAKKLNLYHIGPNRRPKPEYGFEMLVLSPQEEDEDEDHNILQLKSEAVSIEDGIYPSSTPLYVSYDYFQGGQLSMQIRISKIDDAVESGTNS